MLVIAPIMQTNFSERTPGVLPNDFFILSVYIPVIIFLFSFYVLIRGSDRLYEVRNKYVIPILLAPSYLSTFSGIAAGIAK